MMTHGLLVYVPSYHLLEPKIPLNVLTNMKQLLTQTGATDTHPTPPPLVSCTYTIDFPSTFLSGTCTDAALVIGHICEMLSVNPNSFWFGVKLLLVRW